MNTGAWEQSAGLVLHLNIVSKQEAPLSRGFFVLHVSKIGKNSACQKRLKADFQVKNGLLRI